MDYIWNRTCNVALRMLLDDILTSEERPKEFSQQEFNYALDLLEACAGCLRTSGDEILAELSHYRRSATEQTDTSHLSLAISHYHRSATELTDT